MTHNMESFKDELSLNLFGRARSVAISGQSCVCCGGRADIFTDELSLKEFTITGLCQACQDDFFNNDEEEA